MAVVSILNSVGVKENVIGATHNELEPLLEPEDMTKSPLSHPHYIGSHSNFALITKYSSSTKYYSSTMLTSIKRCRLFDGSSNN